MWTHFTTKTKKKVSHLQVLQCGWIQINLKYLKVWSRFVMTFLSSHLQRRQTLSSIFSLYRVAVCHFLLEDKHYLSDVLSQTIKRKELNPLKQILSSFANRYDTKAFLTQLLGIWLNADLLGNWLLFKYKHTGFKCCWAGLWLPERGMLFSIFQSIK